MPQLSVFFYVLRFHLDGAAVEEWGLGIATLWNLVALNDLRTRWSKDRFIILNQIRRRKYRGYQTRIITPGIHAHYHIARTSLRGYWRIVSNLPKVRYNEIPGAHKNHHPFQQLSLGMAHRYSFGRPTRRVEFNENSFNHNTRPNTQGRSRVGIREAYA